MNPETKLQNLQLLALSDAGCLAWRNETAGSWVGKVIHKERDTVTLANARMIQAGLCKGGSDVIAVTPVVVTPEMVGQTLGVFTAAEVKTKTGRATTEQQRFVEAVQRAGGFAGITRSVEDVLRLIGRG